MKIDKNTTIGSSSYLKTVVLENETFNIPGTKVGDILYTLNVIAFKTLQTTGL